MWTALPTAILLSLLGMTYYSAGLHLTGWAHAPPAVAWYLISAFIWQFKRGRVSTNDGITMEDYSW